MPESSVSNLDGKTPPSVRVHLVAVLLGHDRPVDEVRFSPDGVLVVSADDHTVRFWAVNTHSLQRTLDLPASNLTFAPGGTMLAFTTVGGSVQLRSSGGDLMAELPPQGRLATAIAFTPDGTLIATGDELGRIHLWDMASHQLLMSFHAAPHSVDDSRGATTYPVNSIYFGPDGTHLAAVCDDQRGNLHLWTIAQPGPRAEWVATAARDLTVFAMTGSPDGALLAVSDAGNSGVQFLDANTLTRRGQLIVEAEVFKAIAFSPDGGRLAAAGGAGTVYIWDLASQRIVARIAAHTDGADYRTNAELWAIGGIDWSSVGGLIVTSGTSPFTFYNPATGRFTGPADYTVKLWEVREDERDA